MLWSSISKQGHWKQLKGGMAMFRMQGRMFHPIFSSQDDLSLASHEPKESAGFKVAQEPLLCSIQSCSLAAGLAPDSSNLLCSHENHTVQACMLVKRTSKKWSDVVGQTGPLPMPLRDCSLLGQLRAIVKILCFCTHAKMNNRRVKWMSCGGNSRRQNIRLRSCSGTTSSWSTSSLLRKVGGSHNMSF